MYWLTRNPCPKCHYIADQEYKQIKKDILKELKTKPSNSWPDEYPGGFPLGLVKIYKTKRRHQFLKYEMRCFQCGLIIDGETYESSKRPTTSRDVDGTICMVDLRQKRLSARPGKRGLYKYGIKVVPEIERFG